MLTCAIHIKNWLGCRTCDKEVGCLTLTVPHSRNDAGQVVHTQVTKSNGIGSIHTAITVQ